MLEAFGYLVLVLGIAYVIPVLMLVKWNREKCPTQKN